MSTETEHLGLYKYDPVADAAKTFNISTALNNNWDKIDADSKSKDTAIKGTVKFDAAQSLTTGQQAQARSNIGAASKETQDAVFAKTPAGKSVTLTPAELPDYLKALPRMLTENLTITLTAGTVTKDIELAGLYGGGHLWIKAAEGADVQFAKSFMVLRCKSVFFSGLKFVGGQVYNGAHFVAYESFVWMSGCSFDAESNPTENGFIATNGSRAFLENGAFTNCKTAAQAIGSSTVTLSNMSGSGNTVGNSVWNGGIILLYGSTPELLGGASNAKDGGLIVKANGTLL